MENKESDFIVEKNIVEKKYIKVPSAQPCKYLSPSQ